MRRDESLTVGARQSVVVAAEMATAELIVVVAHPTSATA